MSMAVVSLDLGFGGDRIVQPPSQIAPRPRGAEPAALVPVLLFSRRRRTRRAGTSEMPEVIRIGP
jgi:hypothetical protein